MHIYIYAYLLPAQPLYLAKPDPKPSYLEILTLDPNPLNF